ncbi:galactokinase [Spinellus fusiger]|nr:galactokinase [Spinellus fusiger]
MSDTVPVCTSLDAIYDTSCLLKQGVRYNDLISRFKEIYGCSPEYIVRSPGRVNLIGEHIDYCGFGVLPMAIERDIVILGAVSKETSVSLANADLRYPAREFDYEGKEKVVTIDNSQHEWSNYFKCGYKGILENVSLDQPKGLSLLVHGSVPAGGGLSSSAAFVCAAALSVATANQLSFTKQELAEIAITAERNVGVNGGGMDQSASIFSQKGYALRVEFVPSLTAQHIQLPSTRPPLAFVIANTLVKADKFVTAPRHYNLRVVETKMAALFLSKAFGLPQQVDTLREVFDLYFSTSSLSKKQQFSEILHKAQAAFPRYDTEGYTLEQVATMTDIPQDILFKNYMERFPVETDYFRLQQRTQHVFSEASRVYEFADRCENVTEDTLEALGGLMNDSQTSCKESFDCSCPEIDALCAIALKNGAYGARLTGAGWGGCTVMLTDEKNVTHIIDALKEHYYRPNFPELSEDELDDAIISTKPCGGAAVLDIM